jgi:hypothetical protein
MQLLIRIYSQKKKKKERALKACEYSLHRSDFLRYIPISSVLMFMQDLFSAYLRFCINTERNILH